MAIKMAKIGRDLEGIIKREQRKNPYLGVRKLSLLIKDKYGLTVSKSAVNVVLAKSGKSAYGRKPYSVMYKRAGSKNTGFLALLCFDVKIGLIDSVTGGLRAYFPRVKVDFLRKITALLILSPFMDETSDTAKNKELFKIAGFNLFPSRKADNLICKIRELKPVISTREIKKGLKTVSSVKFHFKGGKDVYCDAKFSTLWEAPCHFSHFHTTLNHTKALLNKFIKDNIIMINYTKSFDYLAPLTVDFISGLGAGVSAIDIISVDKVVLESISFQSPLKFDFLIGYHPKILARGAFVQRYKGRFKRVKVALGELFYNYFVTKFFQPETDKTMMAGNIIISRKSRGGPSWGVITNCQKDKARALQKYISFWPYLEEVFLEDMEIINKYFLTSPEVKKISAVLPPEVILEEKAGFKPFADALWDIFTAAGGETAILHKQGEIFTSRDVYKILLKNLPSGVKSAFNKTILLLNDKRVIFI